MDLDHMARRLVAVVITLLLALACAETPLPERDEAVGQRRLALLARAFSRLPHDLTGTAELLAQAGPGPTLERVRLEVWLYCLAQSRAGSDRWLSLVEQRLPDDLHEQALLGLARALRAEHGSEQSIVTVLEWAGTAAADEQLLRCSEQGARRRAAARLALSEPHRLRRTAPTLEAQVLAGLDPGDWLIRARAWREGGRTGPAIAELQSRHWQGKDEQRRTLELARAWAEHGSPQRALDLLPARQSSEGGALLVRALAYRTQAWQRFPRSSAQDPFHSCLGEAGRAARALAGTAEHHEALRLVVECGTETGELAEALDAWWQLVAAGWQHPKRDWFGRRLAVAVAAHPELAATVPQMIAALPDHERCLRYWAAPRDEQRRRPALVELAEVEIGDLYSQWARQELGWEQPLQLDLPAAVGAARPPSSIRQLQGWGASTQASLQWRRLRDTRGASPAEALAAAGFERSRGRPDLAIRWLRTVCPELGTVNMHQVPRDMVEAYLPLRWPEQVQAAAREFGLPPWLIAGLARQESIFGAHARSRAGAIGVLQLIPSTAQVHSRALGLGSRPDLTDPAVNLRLGARELARLVRAFGAVEPALASYNAGEGRVRRWWRYWPERHDFTEAIPIDETYTYVRRVTFLAEAYRLVYDQRWPAEH